MILVLCGMVACNSASSTVDGATQSGATDQEEQQGASAVNDQEAQNATPNYEQEYKLTDGKKAIVILPGLLASGLYDRETGEALWDPIKSDAVDMLEFMGVYDQTHENVTAKSALGEFLDMFDYVADIIGDTKNSIMRHIMCNEKGDPQNPNVVGVPVGYEGHLAYGALNSYKWWAEGLKEVYGSEYEVVVYNYNWLTDTRYAARDFAEFMRQNNYTETVLIGHSMGGLVATEYLAMGADCRARVDKFIAVAVPFYGSYMASSTFEDPYCYRDLIHTLLDVLAVTIQSYFEDVDFSDAFEKLTGSIDTLYNNMIIPFLFNMKSVYQLLPSAELLALQADIEGQGIFENGERIAAEDLYEWYLTRPFTTTDPTVTKEQAASLENRAIFTDWQQFRAGFYVDKPEGKVFACDLVDTYYVAGVGVGTELSLNVEGESRTAYSAKDGDGTVPLMSATRGISAESDHVYVVEGQTHIPMGTFWAEGQKDAVIEIIGARSLGQE
jgi:pimeloyl-ACP methyl ester carboxylesterase